MIKAVLFDMDGTLVDSEDYYTKGTYTWISKYCDISLKDINKIVGLNMDETYKTLSALSGLSYKEVVKLNNEYFINNPLNYNDYFFNDVKDVLKKLKELNIKLGLCSLSERWMVDNFIRNCNLDNTFDLVLSNNDVKKSKPDPEIYLKALELLNITKKEAVVIEDSYNGILAGKNAGLKVYARNGKKYNIDQSYADYIFDDLKTILNKLIK